MPGVSTKTICALSCVAMPRTMARVVCTLWVTIDTLAPTSWLTSVDLPALGAPISATKPECVGGCCLFGAFRSCGLFPVSRRLRAEGSPRPPPVRPARLERPLPRRRRKAARPCTLTVKSGSWSGPSRLSMHVDRHAAAAWCAHSCSSVLGSRRASPIALERGCPVAQDEVARRVQPAFEIDRGDQRFQRVGAQIDALAAVEPRIFDCRRGSGRARPIPRRSRRSVSALTSAFSRSDSSPSLARETSRNSISATTSPSTRSPRNSRRSIVGAGPWQRALAWVSARSQPLVVGEDMTERCLECLGERFAVSGASDRWHPN